MKQLMLAFCTFAMFSCGVDSQVQVAGEDSQSERGAQATEESLLRSSEKYDAIFESAGKEFGVPQGLLKALSFSLTRYESAPARTEFDGVAVGVGPMALKGSMLTDGARLARVTEAETKLDVTANIRAAAAALGNQAKLAGIERSNLSAWAAIVGTYSGIENAEARAHFVNAEVFSTLKMGVGRFSQEMKQTGQALTVETAVGEFSQVQQGLAVAPDYAGAVWRPSPNFGSRTGTPQMVIIHTCEGGYSGCWGFLGMASSGVSAHYVVAGDGSEISQLVRESDRAFHIGARYDCGLNSNAECGLNGVQANQFTIGIEHAGFASQTTWPTGEIDASARLVCDITKGWGIPRDRQHIVGHGQLQPADRTDPGANWPWTTYIQKINAACGSTPGPTGSIIIDSNNANNDSAKGFITVSANWISSTSTAGYYGSGYWYALTQSISDAAAFSFFVDADQTKTIDAWWTGGSNRAPNATFVAFNAAGTRVGSGVVDQTVNGGQWNQVGSFAFTKGWNKVVLSRYGAANTVVIADALRVR
jgi:N-acetylmuramoyl-L-alanine amidase